MILWGNSSLHVQYEDKLQEPLFPDGWHWYFNSHEWFFFFFFSQEHLEDNLVFCTIRNHFSASQSIYWQISTPEANLQCLEIVWTTVWAPNDSSICSIFCVSGPWAFCSDSPNDESICAQYWARILCRILEWRIKNLETELGMAQWKICTDKELSMTNW